MNARLLALPLAFALGACTQGGAQAPARGTASTEAAPAESTQGLSPKDRDAVDPDGVVRRGVALSDGEALTVGAVYTKAEALNGETVKVTGEVARVCQKSGCWFALRDADRTVRITSKDYKYFVPSNAPGMTATVEGELAVKTLSVEEAQHFADDAAEATGKPADKVEAPVKEIAIASVGLVMQKPE